MPSNFNVTTLLYLRIGYKKCNGKLLCTVNRAVIMTVPDVQRMSVVCECFSACTLTSIKASSSRGWEPVPFLLRPHLLLSVLINPKDVPFSPLFYLLCFIIDLNSSSLKYLMGVVEILLFC